VAVALTEFLSHVLPATPKCPQVLAEKAILDSAADFCKQSYVLRQDISAISVVANQSQYSLANPTDLQIYAIAHLLYDGKKMWPTSEDEMDLNWDTIRQDAALEFSDPDDDWRLQTSARPTLFYQPTPNLIRVIGIPTAALTSGITGRIYVYPAQAATTLDDWVYAEFYEAIAAGALARILAVPDQAWSNTKLAAYYLSTFDQGVSNAKGRGTRGNARDNQSVLRVTSCP
jgi:hypothetical protein